MSNTTNNIKSILESPKPTSDIVDSILNDSESRSALSESSGTLKARIENIVDSLPAISGIEVNLVFSSLFEKVPGLKRYPGTDSNGVSSFGGVKYTRVYEALTQGRANFSNSVSPEQQQAICRDLEIYFSIMAENMAKTAAYLKSLQKEASSVAKSL